MENSKRDKEDGKKKDVKEGKRRRPGKAAGAASEAGPVETKSPARKGARQGATKGIEEGKEGESKKRKAKKALRKAVKQEIRSRSEEIAQSLVRQVIEGDKRSTEMMFSLIDTHKDADGPRRHGGLTAADLLGSEEEWDSETPEAMERQRLEPEIATRD